jgi:large subunit ribosomal protein L6
MSRIGRQPIEVPSTVSIGLSPGRVQVNGPLGELSQQVPARMKIEQGDGEIVVTRPTERGEDRALHGLTRSLIANMVEGVTKGFEKHLEIQGVGYRASLRGTDLELNVGYSHAVVMKPRPGITFDVPAPNQVVVKGTDKQQVGQTAAEIRAVRPPEPYKGKGIRYRDEVVRRKVGKRA